MAKREEDMVFAAGIINDDHGGDGETAEGVEGDESRGGSGGGNCGEGGRCCSTVRCCAICCCHERVGFDMLLLIYKAGCTNDRNAGVQG